MPTLREVTRGVAGLVPRVLPVAAAARTLFFARPTTERSIAWYVARAAERWPDLDAVRTPEGAITFRELDHDANRLANGLRRLGVRQGDNVVLMLENRIEYLMTLAAISKLGAAAVLINTQQRQDVLVHSLNACAPSAFVVGEECVGAVEEVRASVPALDGGRAVWFSDRRGGGVPGGYHDADVLLRENDPVPPWLAEPMKLGDTAYYVFTSGTTGLPKASVMSHLRWEKAGRVFGRLAFRLKPGEAVYAPLPLFHNNALTIGFGMCLIHGAAFATRRRFSASQFLADCERFRAKGFIYIGEVPQYLMALPESPNDAAHAPLLALGNGLRTNVWSAFKRRFNVREVYEIYAASEMNISFLNILNLDETVGVCPASWALVKYDPETGLPLRNAEGRLEEVAHGEPGLLIAEVTKRYTYDGYSDAAASETKLVRDAFKDGDVWFVSGDLLRDVGYWHLQFVDRIGDTFRWKGENVSTLEVERAFAGLPGMRECTVVGVEVPGQPGRAGLAAVVGDAGMDPTAWLEVLRGQLPAYAIPVFVRRVESLSVTGTFKHRKVELRREGADPTRVTDPLWVLDGNAYVPLDRSRWERLASGEFRL
ncbi:MAG: long-chain-acyl-CoA synthetase [Polyangiales bacterium]|nr:long-chain-acyl-CoA synthetase [Myxococcales bacterium]